MVAMIAVFYFLIIRPENKRKKQAEQMRSSLKKGDRVTTIGGMVGKIVQVNDSTIVFETSEDRVRIEVTKWAVQSTGAMEQAAAQKSGKKADKGRRKRQRRLLLSRRKRLRWSRLLLRKKALLRSRDQVNPILTRKRRPNGRRFFAHFFRGPGYKMQPCGIRSFERLGWGGLWSGEEAIVGEADHARLGDGDGCISGAADACGLSDGERQTG